MRWRESKSQHDRDWILIRSGYCVVTVLANSFSSTTVLRLGWVVQLAAREAKLDFYNIVKMLTIIPCYILQLKKKSYTTALPLCYILLYHVYILLYHAAYCSN